VLARIERYHAPYHQVLNETCDRLHAEFGAVWHINCHSMPSNGSPRDEHGDFVLGDRDGTTCAPEFTDFIASFLRGLGYDVRVNEGYKGVEIVRRQGRPGENRHSLQIEVDRSLYMDQLTVYFRKPQLREEGVLPKGGIARFYGKAKIYKSGPVYEEVWRRLVQLEKDRDPNKAGYAVLIEIERAEDLDGEPLKLE